MGCSVFESKEDLILPGKRVDVLTTNVELVSDNHFGPAEIPVAWMNREWPQAGGYPGHSMQNLALRSGPLKKVWESNIGVGSSRRNSLTSQPIVANGLVYTMDSDSQLTCFELQTGQKKWQLFVGAKHQDDTAVGGGVALSGDRLYVANGYSEILSLTADLGEEVWRIALPAPARSAPTILDGYMYVILINGQVMALDTHTGASIWTYRGVAQGSRLRGAPSPAAINDVVVVPFTSGELIALRPENGSVAWVDHLSPPLRLGGLSTVSDIRALPVIDSNIVIALSYADRLVAIDVITSERVWQKEIGGQDTPWIAGNTVFVLTKTAQVFALDLKSGQVRWVYDLPQFEDPTSKDDPLFWVGPVLAGGVLRVAGTEGRMIDINPVTGEKLGAWNIDVEPAVPMVVADETLLVLDKTGTLSAWR